MTSNTILLGAEFDKVISIAVVTLILAFAITGIETLSMISRILVGSAILATPP